MTDAGHNHTVRFASEMRRAACVLDEVSRIFNYAWPEDAKWSAAELRREADKWMEAS